MKRVDPEGVLERALSLHTVRRRSYSVTAPQSLWHIDGNHKLIRWRIVVHGGIDGYSRMVVYLKAAANNRAAMVFQSFFNAVQEYGQPSRVRSDKGRENTDVARFMVSVMGTDRNSHIAGKSVHNQRIERLWRDVFICVLETFYHMFYEMEARGVLHPENEVHLFALQLVFLPQLQNHLESFRKGWNHHRIRSAGNRSPLQMWIRGKSSGISSDPRQLDGEYGVDWSSEGQFENNNRGVLIPEINLRRPLSEEELSTLSRPTCETLESGRLICKYCRSPE
ncbi:hypothetical protein AOXY_G19120 [Acipenser oxyrinchus oxyrinchus]|uniref:Integrase catalytic domain-containing protein n=1 Tax=Acipenser oxyrinchus oxyrinchus TaxID=40147 RepID=A0AAD8D315_ACIOX|nr:hypothetical protein AOXY_G19120 [Acipenser oxyrinchus oxyrinchus]